MNAEKQPAVAGPVEPKVRPWQRCSMHGPSSANRWACPDCLVELRDENRALRRLLAVRVAGASLYADDGELQDNTQHPCIDFFRDTPADIQRKLQERGLANYRRSLEDDARSSGA